MLIRIWIHSTHPLTGTAATEECGTLSLDGWLELLRVISQLAETETPAREKQTGRLAIEQRCPPERPSSSSLVATRSLSPGNSPAGE